MNNFSLVAFSSLFAFHNLNISHLLGNDYIHELLPGGIKKSQFKIIVTEKQKGDSTFRPENLLLPARCYHSSDSINLKLYFMSKGIR